MSTSRSSTVAALAVGFLAALAAPAASQTMADAKPATLLVAGGLAIPVGELSDIASTGFIGLAGVTYRRLGLPIAARAEVLYHHLGANEDEAYPTRAGFVMSDRVATLGLAASAVLTLSDTERGQFYAVGGFGVYRQNVKGVSAPGGPGGSVEDNTTRGGFNVGAGFERPLGGANWFLEARLHQMFSGTPRGSVLPVTIGIRF